MTHHFQEDAKHMGRVSVVIHDQYSMWIFGFIYVVGHPRSLSEL